MNTTGFLEKGREYAKERYPDEYSEKADGRITHAFVDGAIYATVAAWRQVEHTDNGEVATSDIVENLPVILFNENTLECVFADTSVAVAESFGRHSGFTHYLPTEYPFTIDITE